MSTRDESTFWKLERILMSIKENLEKKNAISPKIYKNYSYEWSCENIF